MYTSASIKTHLKFQTTRLIDELSKAKKIEIEEKMEKGVRLREINSTVIFKVNYSHTLKY